jgi:outer membrane protein
MNLRLLVIALVAMYVSLSPAFAAGGTIATVNIQQIMHDSTAAKSVKEQLEAKQKAFQAQMSKKEEELQKEDQDLAKERAVLSPDAFDKKLKEFKEKATAAQKEVQAKRAELDNAFSTALLSIQKAISDIVSSVAKEKGYSVVIPASELLYVDQGLDITQTVLAKLNSTLPKVTVSFKSVAQKDDE